METAAPYFGLVDRGRMSTTVHGVEEVLRRCREEGRAALIGYLPVGFPTVEGSIEAMRVLVDAGCDVVEVGVPYSDPLMDGPVIQHAAATALAGGTRVDDVFLATAAVREAGGSPLVMTYWNLVLRRGVARFAADLAAAGGVRADHARPDPRGGRRLDRGQRPSTGSTGSSSSPRRPPPSG